MYSREAFAQHIAELQCKVFPHQLYLLEPIRDYYGEIDGYIVAYCPFLSPVEMLIVDSYYGLNRDEFQFDMIGNDDRYWLQFEHAMVRMLAA